MRILLLALLVAAAAGTPGAAKPATVTIRGKVMAFRGGKAAPTDDVWVYVIEKGRRTKAQSNLPTAQIVQKHTEFLPHVQVVPKNTLMQFPNLDSEDHNVFSPDPFFDLGRYKPNATPVPTHKFEVDNAPDDASDFSIYCDIHKCMWARVKVIDVPGAEYITRVAGGNASDAGTFELHVPPGKYQAWAWTAASTPVHSDVFEVRDGGTLDLGEQLHVQIGALPADHLDKGKHNYNTHPIYDGRCP